MADQNPMAPSAEAAGDDLQDQALVLDRLLVHWPTHLQEADLQRELALGDDDFDHRDRVDHAIVALHWAGLALRSDPVVIPTRAALHYHQLSGCGAADL
jgi:hypothetical protein